MKKNIFNYENQILPSQEFLTINYKGKKKDYFKKLYNVLEKSQNLKNINKKYKLKSSKIVSIREMSSPPQSLNLLKTITDLSKSKTVLEIGTFLGISAMAFASVNKNIKVTTIEKFDEFYKIAKLNIANNGFSKKINVINSDAMKALKTLKKKYDLIFIDGNKENYLAYLKSVIKNNTKHGSIIIVDNILFHGDVLNPKPTTEKGKGAKNVLDFVKDSKLFSSTLLLPMYDGSLILKIK
jgi:caffeoyl-CoA O-methyltransferase